MTLGFRFGVFYQKENPLLQFFISLLYALAALYKKIALNHSSKLPG